MGWDLRQFGQRRKEMKRVLAIVLAGVAGAAWGIDCIWLTHRTDTQERTVINWHTAGEGAGVVRWGESEACERVAKEEGGGEEGIHFAEIPTPGYGKRYWYRIECGGRKSRTWSFETAPADEVRVAVVGNLGFCPRKEWETVRADKPHMIMTAGDNVGQVHGRRKGDLRNVGPFLRLMRSSPETFATLPFMPVLGNHDKEVGPRSFGRKPYRSKDVYDVDATAFLSVYRLPEKGWRWSFRFPQCGVAFLAVDAQHLSDLGTTLQSCHDMGAGDEQYGWYTNRVAELEGNFRVTVFNASVRGFTRCAGGIWGKAVKGTELGVTGFGYYGEQVVLGDGMTFFNTSMANPNGATYPYSRKEGGETKFLEACPNYLLLTFAGGRGEVRAELKDARDGRVMATSRFAR